MGLVLCWGCYCCCVSVIFWFPCPKPSGWAFPLQEPSASPKKSRTTSSFWPITSSSQTTIPIPAPPSPSRFVFLCPQFTPFRPSSNSALTLFGCRENQGNEINFGILWYNHDSGVWFVFIFLHFFLAAEGSSDLDFSLFMWLESFRNVVQ